MWIIFMYETLWRYNYFVCCFFTISPYNHHHTLKWSKTVDVCECVVQSECVLYLYISCGNFNTMIQGVHIYAILNEMENIKKNRKKRKRTEKKNIKHTTYKIYINSGSRVVLFFAYAFNKKQLISLLRAFNSRVAFLKQKRKEKL